MTIHLRHRAHTRGRRFTAQRLLLALVVAPLLLAACRTFEEPEITTTVQDTVAERITHALESPFPARAVPLINSSREQIGGERASDLLLDTVRRLQGRLVEAVAEDDYRRAIAVRRSLDTLEVDDGEGDFDVSRLYLLFSEYLLSNNDDVAALSMFLRVPDKSSITDESLAEMGRIAVSQRNRYALGVVTEILEDRGMEVPDKFASVLETAPTPAELLSGTATVYVDKGIRLEGGVGFPDRVIGSGFFVDPRGYLITNYHVIESEVNPEYEGYSRLFIRLPDNPEERVPARVVGYDRVFDLAMVKAEIEPDYVFSLTDVRTLDVGTRIFALGSPGGLENTITSGIISAVGRRFLQMGDAMQVDVPINPGNSGGPLVDEDGRLVGVVFAGIEQFEGINFAIPSHWIRRFVAELFRDREVIHPWMGVAVYETDLGLETAFVAPTSPAEEAGIQQGDIVLSIAGREVSTIGDAQDVLLGEFEGTLLPVRVRRGGEEKSLLVALGSRPFDPVSRALRRLRPPALFPVLFGMEVEDVDPVPFQPEFSISRIYPGQAADETGLSEGDPFVVQRWLVDEQSRIAAVQIIVRRRKAGFVERGIQLAAFLERDNFL